VLRNFTSDDGHPVGGLTVSGSVLYGMTMSGGSWDHGTVFKLNTNGTGYRTLKHFTGGDGDIPVGSMAFSSGTLYGTTSLGGHLDLGTVFKLDLSAPISLTAQALGNAIILSWGDPAFALHAAPAVTGTYTNVPDATSPYTNAISEPRRFFRLVKP
jgi:uncharacterized repeat protein (TIGR03803 family)